ncbi:MAG: type I-E CRISPR-associated protein Cas5/CasD [Gaiellaceae bacterium]
MTASTLRIWLAGPLQSWGFESHFEARTTSLVPTKSAVIGLVCAAMGRPRSEPVDDLAALRFGVRVERPGTLLRDYHTVGAGDEHGIAVASGARGRGIVTLRYYLADAAFVAGLESPDRDQLRTLRDALSRPRWLLSLGRRSCPPAGPLVDDGALVDAPLEDALARPWSIGGRLPPHAMGLAEVELLIESPDGEHTAFDQPIDAAFAARTFGVRRVRSVSVPREEATP